MAQWITRLTTDQKIPGSNPGRFENIFWLTIRILEPSFGCSASKERTRIHCSLETVFTQILANQLAHFGFTVSQLGGRKPGSYGVMVSTQDFESCDPSSNLGRTSCTFSLRCKRVRPTE